MSGYLKQLLLSEYPDVVTRCAYYLDTSWQIRRKDKGGYQSVIEEVVAWLDAPVEWGDSQDAILSAEYVAESITYSYQALNDEGCRYMLLSIVSACIVSLPRSVNDWHGQLHHVEWFAYLSVASLGMDSVSCSKYMGAFTLDSKDGLGVQMGAVELVCAFVISNAICFFLEHAEYIRTIRSNNEKQRHASLSCTASAESDSNPDALALLSWQFVNAYNQIQRK